MTGNCDPQEDLLLPVRQDENLVAGNSEQDIEECDDYEREVCIQEVTNLSLFVENIVVYIAGFVGKRLTEKLDCDDCMLALRTYDTEYMQLRQDFSLIHEKDKGGLFKPSEDLTIVCKIAERVIRLEETKGILKLNSKKISMLVARECIGKNLFENLHQFGSTSLRKASFCIDMSHKSHLINSICEIYNRTRLHYIAKTYTLHQKPLTNRNIRRKVTQFRGE